VKRDLRYERFLKHPPERVWRALTEPALMGRWLMETDFAPVVNREFSMWCDDGEGGTDRYGCKVLACDPPRSMRWTWVVDGSQHLGETEVEFRLEKADAGTRLTIRHSGDRDPNIVSAFETGWPWKMDRLGEMLE